MPIDEGVLHAVSDRSHRCQVSDRIRPRVGHQTRNPLRVTKIQLVESKAALSRQVTQMTLLVLKRIVIVEIIEPDDAIAPIEQRSRESTSHKAGDTRN